MAAARAAPGLTRSDLQPRRLLLVWAPLALTFLLLSGGTPVINASINRLPDIVPEEELAAFSLLLGLAIFLQSPLFVTREIAIKLSVDRAGSNAALKICLAAGLCVSALELILGFTPLGAWLLGEFTERTEIIARAHAAIPFIAPMPILIAIRGVYQAHQIRVDDTLFVGFGSLLRLVATGIVGLVFGPALGWPGPRLGAFCMTLGAALEMGFAVWRARARARPPATAPEGTRRLSPWEFAVPLMLANFLGVGSSLFYLKMAGAVPTADQAASLATFQEVRSLQWLVVSGAIALQSLTTAKVRTPTDARAMLRFALMVSGSLTVLFLACVALAPVRRFILVELLGEEIGSPVLELVPPVLLLAAIMPLLQGMRFTLRGVLIARGLTKAITATTLITLLLLATALAFSWSFSERNGGLTAYAWWIAAVLLEIVLLSRYALKARPKEPDLPVPLKSPRESTGG